VALALAVLDASIAKLVTPDKYFSPTYYIRNFGKSVKQKRKARIGVDLKTKWRS
jgi:hypothetical protein